MIKESVFLPNGTVLQKKYTIIEVLGKGGFGITYKALDTVLDREVVIKEYFPLDLASRNIGSGNVFVNPPDNHEQRIVYEKGMQKFLKEARDISKLKDIPHIVKVLDFFYENQTAYIVMEYIQGITMDEYLLKQGGSVSVSEILSILSPLIDSLIELHKKGILHRDISPNNIMIDDGGNIYLIDFGAARQYYNDETKSMTVFEKRGFTPPEQYIKRTKAGPWTDEYALCATIYYLITGCVPPNAMERSGGQEIINISEFGIDISDVQEKAILKGLSIEPSGRHRDLIDFKKDLLGVITQDDKRASKRKISSKVSFVKVTIGLLCLELIILSYIKYGYRIQWLLADKEVTKAGNYYRNTEIYDEYYNYVRNKALKSEVVDGETKYTLSRNDVFEWGAPGNIGNFNEKYSEIESFLNNNYIVIEKKEGKEVSIVNYMEYGDVETEFSDELVYILEDDITVDLKYDYVNDCVNSIVFSCPLSDDMVDKSVDECFMMIEYLSKGYPRLISKKDEWKERILAQEENVDYEEWTGWDGVCSFTFEIKDGVLNLRILPKL